MKKILAIFAASSLFVACNTKSDLDTNKAVVVTDTTNMYKSNASTDINTADQPRQEEKNVAPTKIIRETRVVYVDRPNRSTRQVVHQAAPVDPVVITPTPQKQPENNTNTSNTPSTTTNGNSGTIGSGNTGSTGTSYPSAEQKDKGWSNSAKDAVIGGVGGAVLGAVISKKKGTGAVIGGILGAAGGYILGKKKDKSLDQTTDAKYTSY